MSVVLLFAIIAAACDGYCLISCWRWPRVPCWWCKARRSRIRSSAGRSASAGIAAAKAGTTAGALG
jgi:hypothetical protein